MLEAQCHEHSCFATFTYEKEPLNGSLDKGHISSTFHRIRKAVSADGKSVRFFAVGEYGDQTGRPHYHAAIFGLGVGDQRVVEKGWHALRDAGGAVAGFVHCGDLTPSAAAYIGGYVTKKLDGRSERSRRELGDRQPEFAVMSRRPGIGMLALEPFIEALNTSAGALYMARNGDVPVALSVGSSTLPIGRTIRGHLRRFFFGDERLPERARALGEERFNAGLPAMPVDASPVLRARLLEVLREEASEAHQAHFSKLAQRAKQRAARHKINLSRRVL